MRISILFVLLVGCATTKPAIHDDFNGVGDEKSDAFSQKMRLVGTLQFGQTADVSYHNAPRYVAYKMFGRAGEHVAIDVKSQDGDAVTWLVDASFRIIAQNDDADDKTFDSHLEATLPSNTKDSVDYFVIVREFGLADATFTISIAAPPHDLDTWRGRSIYFVVTDRFANGDPTNDNADGFATDLADPAAWHGGDFQGLIDHLDYIAGMGFTGIWITPVIRQHDKHAYHGYHGYDWRQIDGHLGDLAKLRELVKQAHARGIAVMIDTVANHTGRYGFQSPTFPDAAMYHHNGNITDFNNQTQVENNDLNGLNDLAQENPVVKQALLDHVRWLVASSGADGLRVDTVKHVPKPFWTDYSATAGVFTIGEALGSSVNAVSPYSHALDAVLDYPLYFGARDVFAKSGSARGLGTLFAQDAGYSDARLGGVFVDNHDQPRFLCDANGATDADKLAQLRLALAFALTTRGVPIMYYGTEQGFKSCTDNRQDMFAAFDPTQPLYQYVHQLNQLRNASEALRTGTQLERWQDATSYAFEREAGTSAAIVAFNLDAKPRMLALKHMHVPAGTVFHDTMGTGAAITVDAAGNISVSVPARSAVVLTN